jgi:hypothetical protein
MTPEEHFARIDERLAILTEHAIETDAALKNTNIALTRFITETTARFADVAEKLDNSRILLDRLIKRDLERGDAFDP